jgi:hypothetical protein
MGKAVVDTRQSFNDEQVESVERDGLDPKQYLLRRLHGGLRQLLYPEMLRTTYCRQGERLHVCFS